MTAPILGNACFYGPDAVLGTTGIPATSTPVDVYETGTTTPIQLYTDNTMATTASNPVDTDDRGNLGFFAGGVGRFVDLHLTISGVDTTIKVILRPWPTDTEIPTGTIFDFAGSVIPDGYLACDGSSQLRTDFPRLFLAIGTTWGSVDGTHFTLPDSRGRVALGSGTGTAHGATAHALGAKPTTGAGGEETHKLLAGESGLVDHVHPYSEGAPSTSSSAQAPGYNTLDNLVGANTGGVNGGAADAVSEHNIMGPHFVVTKMIKA